MVGVEDAFLERLERWKKRAISTFGFVSLLTAMVVVFLIEVSGLVDVMKMKFPAKPTAATGASSQPKPETTIR